MQAEKLPRASISPGAGDRSRSPFSPLLELELTGVGAVGAECISTCSVCAQSSGRCGQGEQDQARSTSWRAEGLLLCWPHLTKLHPTQTKYSFCHGGVNSNVTGLKSLSTLSFLDKGPMPHTWTETFCGWFQRLSLEKVRALLGVFLFPESLFSCNSECYVREQDKIRILDKNSTKRNVHLLPAFWGHFGVFSGS